MFYDEALRLLKSGSEGVKAWNKWRQEICADEPPALSEVLDFDQQVELNCAILLRAELADADLRNVDFHNTCLSGAILDGADLRGAVLRNAELNGADLSGANLTGADLHKADLTFVDFTDADLTDADMTYSELAYTNLSSTELKGANIAGAHVGATVWGYIDLSKVTGLDKIFHVGKSILGLDTILMSGRLPDEFLLGCGVPETLLGYIKSLPLSLEPIQYYSCFISYSHQDEEFAQRLHGRLRQSGLRVWFAPEDIQGGKKLHHQIDDAIRVHDKLLLVLSEASINSEWVKTEIAKARKREVKEGRQVLFPIRLVDMETIQEWECFDADTGKDSAREIREYFIPDFSEWKDHDKFEQAFTRLIADLKQSAEPKAAS